MRKIIYQLSQNNIYTSPAAKARFLWLFLAALLLPVVASLSQQSEYERSASREREEHSQTEEVGQ